MAPHKTENVTSSGVDDITNKVAGLAIRDQSDLSSAQDGQPGELEGSGWAVEASSSTTVAKKQQSTPEPDIPDKKSDVFTSRLLFRTHYYEPGTLGGDIDPRLKLDQAFRYWSREAQRTHLNNHCDDDNRMPTPFVSVTYDLSWVLIRMFGNLFDVDPENTCLVFIDWEALELTTDLDWCNKYRQKAGLPKQLVKWHELLVERSIPASATLHYFSHKQLCDSGLMDALPALEWLKRPGYKSVTEFRERMNNNKAAFTLEATDRIAKALIRKLRMDHESTWAKQIFLFLLGLARGWPIHNYFEGNVRRLLEDEEAVGLIDRFDERARHYGESLRN